MNKELTRLIRAVGINEPLEWGQVVVLQNFAPIPVSPRRVGSRASKRGFNFVILKEGRPGYFCKSRPVDHGSLERESRLVRQLAELGSERVCVPMARYASSDRMSLQAGDFVDGIPYSRVVGAESIRTYLRTVHEIVDWLAAAVQEVRADYDDVARSIGVAAEASSSVAQLRARLTLEPMEWEGLESALRSAGRVPSLPQHGDLWAENILIDEGRAWVIDFDTFGELHVPLYDEFTLLCSTLDIRLGSPEGSDCALLRSDKAVSKCLELVQERALQLGLEPCQLDGLLVFHLVHRAARIARRAGPTHGRRHDHALLSVARRLASGQLDLWGP